MTKLKYDKDTERKSLDANSLIILNAHFLNRNYLKAKIIYFITAINTSAKYNLPKKDRKEGKDG